MKEEYQAMLAGIPLMSAAEQQEFFDAVRSIMFQQVDAGMAVIAAGAASAPIDKRVAKFVALRDARAKSNKDATNLDQAYKGALEAIENSLIADAQRQGVEGFKTDAGTTYLAEDVKVSIADEHAFFTFVKESGDLDFFERRVKSAHVKEWQEANGGVFPPGLNVFRELSMKVRRK